MRNLHELNINKGGRPVDTPAPTASQIAHVESLVGAPLPGAYIGLLMFSNGGHPELSSAHFIFEGKAESWGVNDFFRISTNPNSTGDVVWNYNNRWSGAPRSMLPIGNDGMGSIICLDLSESDYGSVVVRVHDDPDVSSLRIAASFEEFIDSLTLYQDDI